MNHQITMDEFLRENHPEEIREPEVGEYVEHWGQNIPHIMRSSWIGKKVVYDCSTQSHRWMRVGLLERYFPHDGTYRSVIYVGSKQRILYDHRQGRTIFAVK